MSPNTNSLNVPSTRPSPSGPKEDVSKANAEERGAAGASDPKDNTKDDTRTSEEISKVSEDGPILYSIICRSNQSYRSKQYDLPENPFEKSTLHKEEAPSSSLVLRVYVTAKGYGRMHMFQDYQEQSTYRPPPPPPPRGAPYIYEEPLYPPANPYGEQPRPSRRSNRYPRSSRRPKDNLEFSDSEDEGSFVATSRRGLSANGEGSDVAKDSEQSSGEEARTQKEAVQKDLKELKEFRASMVEVSSIDIFSRHLLKLIRSVVREYPGQTLKGDSITVRAPFRVLAHHYKDLLALRDSRISGPTDPIASDEEKKDFQKENEHLNILLNYFERHWVEDFAPVEARFLNTGVTSYDKLWLLFKPGTTVYARSGGKLAAYIFESYEENRREDRGRVVPIGQEAVGVDYRRREWNATCWFLTYNGRRIVRTSDKFLIKEFPGEKDITSLLVFPSEYLDSLDGGRTKSKLTDLGEKYYKIVKESPAHLEYSGPAWDLGDGVGRDAGDWARNKPNTEYSGEIIVDHGRTNYTRRKSSRDVVRAQRDRYYSGSDSDPDDTESDEENINQKPLDALDTKSSRFSFRAINPKEQKGLSPEHYLLLPRAMAGFALSQKQRMGFDVENIKHFIWPEKHIDPMSTLILGESDKDIIKALARKYSKDKDKWGADFIKGKGEGQIFLLHGPPGTGKTYTVECVAKFTRRPLLRLTVADIGTDENEMEDNLGEWFQRGADWGAIILIDEADVFLEKRQIKDLQRNSLVSVFLSSMEYYTGMLFLTTNRIGQIDDAFLSRTSVALTYETLDVGKQQKIWEGFLQKLAEERKDIKMTDGAKKFIEGLDKNEATKDVPWNGREIRNALQTAIAIASYEADKEAEELGEKRGKIIVRPDHFEAVVTRRRTFVEYRRSIRNQDEDARAYVEGNRAMPHRKK